MSQRGRGGVVVTMAALLGCRTIDPGPPPAEPRVVAPERQDVGASEAAREVDDAEEVGRTPEVAIAPVEPPPVAGRPYVDLEAGCFEGVTRGVERELPVRTTTATRSRARSWSSPAGA
jgi:hypothetical protein